MDGLTISLPINPYGHGMTYIYDLVTDELMPFLFESIPPTLERVSIKGLKVVARRHTVRGPEESIPASGVPCEIVQLGLVTLVRKIPSLRWFRSDLSPRYVAMLRKERPEVTFVS
jgi:hypothetical protein